MHESCEPYGESCEDCDSLLGVQALKVHLNTTFDFLVP